MKQDLIVQLNQQPITYNGERCVTLSIVDKFHERRDGHAKDTFGRHRTRFTEGKHYYSLTRKELHELGAWDAPNSLVGNPQKETYLLNEKGYALLVKVFDDDRAWEIQEELVDGYFRVRNATSNTMPGMAEIASLIVTTMQTVLAPLLARLDRLEQVNAGSQSRQPAPLTFSVPLPDDARAGTVFVYQEVRKIWPEATSSQRQAVINQLHRSCGARNVAFYPVSGFETYSPYVIDRVYIGMIVEAVSLVRNRVETRQRQAAAKETKKVEPTLFGERAAGYTRN